MDTIYQCLADFIYKSTGIVYKKSDFYRLEGRVVELIKEFSLENNHALIPFLASSLTAVEENKIIDIATNNETYFFRDNKPFDTLVNEIIEEKKSELPLSIWSTGCSTGQEVYSILMKICDKKGISFLPSVKITATDISLQALKKAESGCYDGIEIQRGLPVKFLTTYFTENSNDGWDFKKEYRQNVSFSQFNLLQDFYKDDCYHVIFCRNVLIYQNKENKEAILKNLYKALHPGGYLLLGSGESLIGFDIPFKQKKLGNMIVFQKPTD